MISLRRLMTGTCASAATLGIGLSVVSSATAAPVRVNRGISTHSIRAQAATGTFTDLHDFTGADGASPQGGLDLGIQYNGNGNFTSTLFGETQAGGTSSAGTIFSYGLNAQNFASLYSFTGRNDGGNPQGGLANNDSDYFSAGGRQFGVTLQGGQFTDGTVFVTTNRTPTVIHAFTGGADGANPIGRITQFTDGNYYGTTSSGALGYGTVFRVTPGGQFSTIHIFTGNADGGAPAGLALRVNLNGNANVAHHGSVEGMVERVRAMNSRYVSPYLYGTTSTGGRSNGSGFGTIFRITPAGKLQTLFTFTGGNDGATPVTRLSTDLSGNLFGTTSAGGSGSSGNGVVFQLIENSNTPIVIHDFGNGAGGAIPLGSITVGLNGRLYGTASQGGAAGFGSLFEIGNNGYVDIHDFQMSDGANPFGKLLDAGDGFLYGTAANGAHFMNGDLFRIVR